MTRKTIQNPLLFLIQVVEVDVTEPLAQLGGLVDDVAAKQKVVFRRDGHGVSHEHCGVHDQGGGHGPRDVFGWLVLQVQDGSHRDPEVRDRPPEMGGAHILERVHGEHARGQGLGRDLGDLGRHLSMKRRLGGDETPEKGKKFLQCQIPLRKKSGNTHIN